jgi:hypothetical protein
MLVVWIGLGWDVYLVVGSLSFCWQGGFNVACIREFGIEVDVGICMYIAMYVYW